MENVSKGTSDLTTVTSYLSEEHERYWTINDELFALLAHHSLQSLTLSCAEVPRGSIIHVTGTSSTPLKELTLIERSLDIGALQITLLRPQALRALHLGT